MQQADTSLRYNQHCYTVDMDLRKIQINYMLGIYLGSLDQVKSFITDFINSCLHTQRASQAYGSFKKQLIGLNCSRVQYC